MKIVQYPHPSLRHKAVPLKAIDKKVEDYVRLMFDLMYESKGLGLAAPQVGLPFQFFITNPAADPEQKDQEEVYINPVIVERKGSQEGEEGCLSFPGLYLKVRRAKSVQMQAYTLKGEAVTLDAVDIRARVFQHEIDHLHGDLYIDKVGPIGKIASRSTLKEFVREYKKAQEKGHIPPDAEIEKLLKELEGQA
jgi:peptide deformylase